MSTTKNVAVAVAVSSALLVAYSTTRTDEAISKVIVSGLTTGTGLSTSPIDVPVTTTSNITGHGTVADPYSASDFYGVGLGLFGGGTDGDVTISGSTTLTRDMYYNNLTLDPAAVVNPGGYHIQVRNTLTLGSAAAIRRNGGGGTTGPNASNSIGGCSSGAGGGNSTTGGVLPTSSAGGARASAGPNATASIIAYEFGADSTPNGGATFTGSAQSGGVGGNGARGRGGGGGFGGNAPGSGACGFTPGNLAPSAGNLPAEATNLGSIRNPFAAISGEVWSFASSTHAKFATINAGGGGGGCGCNTGTSVTSTGGGGGGGGGYIVVIARKMVCNGCAGIEAKGGAGGAGGTGAGIAGQPGAGGGGGGPGGIIVCVHGSGSCLPTSVKGGGSEIPRTTGLGGAGTTGSGNGGNGGIGGDGMVIDYRMGPA